MTIGIRKKLAKLLEKVVLIVKKLGNLGVNFGLCQRFYGLWSNNGTLRKRTDRPTNPHNAINVKQNFANSKRERINLMSVYLKHTQN